MAAAAAARGPVGEVLLGMALGAHAGLGHAGPIDADGGEIGPDGSGHGHMAAVRPHADGTEGIAEPGGHVIAHLEAAGADMGPDVHVDLGGIRRGGRGEIGNGRAGNAADAPAPAPMGHSERAVGSHGDDRRAVGKAKQGQGVGHGDEEAVGPLGRCGPGGLAGSGARFAHGDDAGAATAAGSSPTWPPRFKEP